MRFDHKMLLRTRCTNDVLFIVDFIMAQAEIFLCTLPEKVVSCVSLQWHKQQRLLCCLKNGNLLGTTRLYTWKDCSILKWLLKAAYFDPIKKGPP